MTVNNDMGAAELLRKYLESPAGSDLLGEMVKMAAELLMDADVDVICNAGYNERSEDRLNSRNGIGHGAGTHGQAPSASTSQSCAKAPTCRACWSRAVAPSGPLVSVICQAYVEGVSTRRVDDLVKSMASGPVRRTPGEPELRR